MSTPGTHRPDSALSPAQSRAAELLAAGRTGVAVAKELAIGVRTLRTWSALPAFRAEVRRLRAAALDEALSKLSSASAAAASALVDLLSDPEGALRLRAATAILAMQLKVREQHELAERVAEIEAQLAESGGQGGARWRAGT